MTKQLEYAKVRVGWTHLYLGFFCPGTLQEDRVAREVAAVLERNEGAVASVSAECVGALRDVAVIGDFPILKLDDHEHVTDAGRRALESISDGRKGYFDAQRLRTARALVADGYVVECNGSTKKMLVVTITEKGSKRLAEMAERRAA